MSRAPGIHCGRSEPCKEIKTCTPQTCEYGQKGWECTAYHVQHLCAHDFSTGPWVEMDNGGTATCECGLSALSHDMRYAP